MQGHFWLDQRLGEKLAGDPNSTAPSDLVAIAAADEAEASLDFVDPQRPARHGAGVGGQAWLDEAGRTANGTRVVPVHDVLTVCREPLVRVASAG